MNKEEQFFLDNGITFAESDKLADIIEMTLALGEDATDQEYIVYDRKFLRVLNKLERKYGELPYIYWYKGNTYNSIWRKEKAFLRGYEVAIQRHDKKHCVEIAFALAEIYITELKELQKGRVWLKTLRADMQQYRDDYIERNICQLDAEIKMLEQE